MVGYRGAIYFRRWRWPVFQSITGLNKWLSECARLGEDESGFDCKLSDFAFCHLDLCRRNMIMLSNQSFGLPDYEFAEIYPRCLRVTAFALWERRTTISLRPSQMPLKPSLDRISERKRTPNHNVGSRLPKKPEILFVSISNMTT
jgi:Choline/ethanolamine kinase